MEKMTNAEITLTLANGQLTIAAAPDAISGLNLLKYLDLAECAIIGANYTDTNTAINTAMEHASAIIAGVMHTVGDENTRPKMGAIVHATQVSPFHLHCVIQKPSAPAAKGKFSPKKEDCTSASITPTATHGRKNLQIGSSFSFGSLASLAATPMERP